MLIDRFIFQTEASNVRSEQEISCNIDSHKRECFKFTARALNACFHFHSNYFWSIKNVIRFQFHAF